MPRAYHPRCGFLLAFLLLAGAARGNPRIPVSDDEVLENLPVRPQLATTKPSPADPRDALDAALSDSRRLIIQAKSEGDPRYLGYAEARISPWLRLPNPPLPVRLMRARLRQSTHRFDDALADLGAVLNKNPGNPEALLLQASIWQVQGHYARAYQACRALGGVAVEIAMTCMAQEDSLDGHAAEALQRLRVLSVIIDGELTPDQQAWLHLGMGDIASRLDDDKTAEQSYRAALAGGGPDALATWADWLLDHHRPAEVIPLLQGWTRNDNLLLRLTEAESVLHRPEASEHVRELVDRFAALRLRGETSHQREEAMFQLNLMHNSGEALRLARSNWQQQREPADVLIYLAAARAANSDADVAVIKDWLHETHLEDRRLRPLLAKGIPAHPGAPS